MKYEQRRNNMTFIERLEHDIFYCIEKFSIPGVAGYKQRGSQEEREKRLNDKWARKPRQAAAASERIDFSDTQSQSRR